MFLGLPCDLKLFYHMFEVKCQTQSCFLSGRLLSSHDGRSIAAGQIPDRCLYLYPSQDVLAFVSVGIFRERKISLPLYFSHVASPRKSFDDPSKLLADRNHFYSMQWRVGGRFFSCQIFVPPLRC